jgi:uncharacterized repeat protein (TIGR01451 family)
LPGLRRLLKLCILLCCLAAAVSTVAASAAPIVNTASMSFGVDGVTRTVASNTVSYGRPTGLPAAIRFGRIPPIFDPNLPIAACRAGISPLIAIQASGQLPPGAPDVGPANNFDPNAPVMIILTNPSGNLDPAAIDHAKVVISSSNGDVEHLTLAETGPDTGLFKGAIAGAPTAPVSDNCILQTEPRLMITVMFDGGEDDTNNAWATALIDPYGYVFDSLTGEPVDGVAVTLINTDTGQPAQVFGNDGVSAYPSTVISGQSVTDAGGSVYSSDPGEYRFPQLAAGHYQLRFVTPSGYVAPSTVAPDQLRTLTGPAGAFVILDASYGKSFALDQPDPLQVDVPVDRINAALTLDKQASTRIASPGDTVQYRLRLVNRDGEVTARGVTISDILPAGMRYRRGSARGIGEPDIGGDGRSLTFHPGLMRPGSVLEIRYSVSIQPGAPVGEALNRAIAMNAAGERSAEGRASVRIQPLLNSHALTIIGRVTEGDCGIGEDRRKGVPNVRLLMEDGTYVVTDRDGLYHIEGVRAGRHVVQVDTQSLGAGLAPIDCARDTRQAGQAFSRFVEGSGGTLQRADFALRRDLAKAVAAERAITGPVIDDATAAGSGIDWLDGQTPGIDMLFPASDHNPRAPVLRVVIKHLPGQTIALRLNGAPVDVLARDQGDGNGQVAIAKWTGLPLKDGDNALEAVVSDSGGHAVATLGRTVHYANVAANVEYLRDRSRAVADGITRPVIAVRLTDRAGRPVRAGTPVAFRIDPPYAAAVEADAQQARPLSGLDGARPTGRVAGDDGVALIALQPTAQAGAVRMSFDFARDGHSRSVEIRPWLQAAARDWVVVGFGAGSAGYDILSGKARRTSGLRRHDAFTDGQIAFYAKGRIKGSWLLTMAYDSARKADPDRGLLGTIDPDRYYTVYGDRTRQGYDAATRGKLYLRLERHQFYALFGDYETGFNQTELTRFSRTLHGVKGEFRGRDVAIGGFAANSDDLYARDEIQGNGLSGPYRLRARAIVPNSDKIRIETRDRFRSELIVETRALSRHIDYDIDVDAGTLVFKAPVPVRDSAGNPVFIVAEYEQFGNGAKRLVAGARATATLAKGRIELGATALHDESQSTKTIGGVDAKLKITRTTSVRIEAAAGGTAGVSDRAYVAEVQHHADRTDLTAYVRQQDAGYGLNQLNAVEAGTRKFGADGRLKLGRGISLTASAWHQEALTGTAVRDAADLRAEWRGDATSFHAGIKIAEDRSVAGLGRSSRLVALGGSRELFDHKLIVSAENQFALGHADASVDFPVRRTVGASWQLTDAVRLIAGYERAEGDKYAANSVRAGFDLAPWAGAKLTSTMNQDRIAENGPRAYAQFGLAQSLPIGKSWSVDAAVDMANTVKGRIPTADIVNPLQPVASVGSLGQDGNPNEDYRSVSLGATWRGDAWSWNGRAEQRDGDSSSRWGLSSNLLRQLGEGRTLGSTARWYRISQKSGASGDRAVASLISADLSLAWRPLDRNWALLERLELRRERGDAGVGSGNLLGVGTANGADALSSRIINNLAINYRSARDGEHIGWEASLYHGVKYVRGRFDDDRFAGLIDVVGFDLRRNIGSRIDVGVSGAVQHSWKDRTIAYSIGPSVGVSPAQNVWISVGYNLKGFHDRDFEDNRTLRQGPFVTMRLKFDQQSLGAAGGRLAKMVGR